MLRYTLRRAMKHAGGSDMWVDVTPLVPISRLPALSFVPQGSTAIVERFGRFHRTATPGALLRIPIIEKVVGVSNRLLFVTGMMRAKTKDNIFVSIDVAMQVRIQPEDAVTAYYSTTGQYFVQLKSLVASQLRAEVSHRPIDRLFEEQSELSAGVFRPMVADAATGETKQSVSEQLRAQGLTLEEVIVRDIIPPPEVSEAMNAINASQRRMEAAKNDADARYIREVRQAEADRDRKRLLGEGLSQQRTAILSGYKTGVDEMATKFGLTPREVLDFVLKAQHLDTMEAVGRSENCKTLFFPVESVDSQVVSKASVANKEMLMTFEASKDAVPQTKTTPPPS